MRSNEYFDYTLLGDADMMKLQKWYNALFVK